MMTTNLPPMVPSPDFGDPLCHWHARKWLQNALEAKGARVTGAGMGGGGADLDIILDGAKFNVTIRPIMRGEARHG